MDPRFFVNMLCQMHVTQTTSDSPPFTFSTDVTTDKLSKDKLTQIIKDQCSLNQFVKLCMEKFTEKYPTQPYGSVHCDPTSWTKIALSTIHKFLRENNSSVKIVFPNGCCTVNDCPINKFYLIVMNEVML